MKRAVLLLAVGVLLAGCSGDDASTGEATTTAAETSTARVYFLRNGKVWPVRRAFLDDWEFSRQALSFLVLGPTPQEKADLGLTNALARQWSANVSTNEGSVRIDLDRAELPAGGLARSCTHSARSRGLLR